MTAEGSRKIAVAPLAAGLATKVTTPPSTGSIGLLAVTVTASGLAKAVPMVEVCGVLPGTTARVKPWLSKAPMSTPPTRPVAALVGRGDVRAAAARVDRRAAGQEGHGLGRAAVVAQRSQQRVGHADDVAVDPVDEPAEPPVPIRLLLPETPTPSMSPVPFGFWLPATIVLVSVASPSIEQAAAEVAAELPLTVQLVSVVVPLARSPPPRRCGIPADRAVGQRKCGEIVTETAAIASRRVAADGAVGQRGRADVEQTAAWPPCCLRCCP